MLAWLGWVVAFFLVILAWHCYTRWQYWADEWKALYDERADDC